MSRDIALGQAIREWRVQHNVRQKGLAQQLGTNRQRIWDWETHGVPDGDAAFVRLAMKQFDADFRHAQAIEGLVDAVAHLTRLINELKEN